MNGLESLKKTLREEYKDTKMAITDWETRMRYANTDSEIQEIKKEISDSIAATIQKGNVSQILLSASKSVPDDAITALTGNGIPGAATAKNLPDIIINTVGLFRRHFRRKKLIYYDTQKNEAANIRNRTTLMKETFGSTLSPTDIDRFSALCHSLDQLTQEQTKLP